MNKKDLKKLALLGMTGGLLVSTQTVNANEGSINADYGSYLAARGCGGGNGSGAACHARSQPQPSYDGNYYPQGQVYQPQGQVYQPQGYSHSCGGSQPSQRYQESAQQNDRYQIQSGVDYSNVPYYNPNNIIAEGPAATTQHQPKLTEAELLKQLNAQGKATYQTLSPEGKALALKFANEDKNRDKNDAVKQAAQKMAEKRSNTLNGNKTKNNR